MTTITKQQALMRWDTLPDPLREALYSEPNSDFIWSTCRGDNILRKAIYDVARIAGCVLLGIFPSRRRKKESRALSESRTSGERYS